MRKMIIDLTAKVAELKVTVDFLRKENETLHKKSDNKKQQLNG